MGKIKDLLLDGEIIDGSAPPKENPFEDQEKQEKKDFEERSSESHYQDHQANDPNINHE